MVCVLRLVLPFAISLMMFGPVCAESLDWVAQLNEKFAKAVVRIETRFSSKDGQQSWNKNGTGFFISENGDVVTAKHLVWKPDQLKIDPTKLITEIRVYTDETNRSFKVSKVSPHSHEDAALLKIHTSEKHPYLSLGGCVYNGSRLMYMGFPLGTRNYKDFRITHLRGIIGSWQADLSTGEASSGSPVINRDGNVVGIIIGSHEKTQSFLTYVLPLEEFGDLISWFKTPDCSDKKREERPRAGCIVVDADFQPLEVEKGSCFTSRDGRYRATIIRIHPGDGIVYDNPEQQGITCDVYRRQPCSFGWGNLQFKIQFGPSPERQSFLVFYKK